MVSWRPLEVKRRCVCEPAGGAVSQVNHYTERVRAPLAPETRKLEQQHDINQASDVV